MNNSWDRLPDETAKAYAAFCAFRDMAPPRSLDGAFRHKNGAPESTRSNGAWRTWTAKYKWNERVRAFDAKMEASALRGAGKAAVKDSFDWGTRNTARREKQMAIAEKLSK